MTSATEALDRQAIRDTCESWVIWRDAGMWDNFRALWHDDGRMMATWFQGGVDAFIAHARESFDRGSRGAHVLGGTAIEIAGHRAIAQSKMSIVSRAPVEGVLCDVVCSGRFYDFFEKRGGRWGLVLRQPIYEKDRIDPVEPGAVPKLDRELLARFPAGYRHLAYVQTKAGFTVRQGLPGASGAALAALYAHGAAWLKGEPLAF
jgi:hypothetical protein